MSIDPQFQHALEDNGLNWIARKKLGIILQLCFCAEDRFVRSIVAAMPIKHIHVAAMSIDTIPSF
jgi:hypothetical protein